MDPHPHFDPPIKKITPAFGRAEEKRGCMKNGESSKSMNVFGVGPKFAALTVLFGILVYFLSARHGAALQMGFLPGPLRKGLGILLIAAGVPLWILSGKTVIKGFREGRLCTMGVYGLCRHPLYASWAVLIVPGIVLLTDNWAAFVIPFFMCGLLRVLVSREERWLEEKFGDEYRSYRKRVPAVLPLGWMHR
jgi:protein-S-isoprenylcysteine O-methyltransferase Ste14